MPRKFVAAACTRKPAMLRKTKLCKFFVEGECERGDKCSFAHSRLDLQGRPDLHKTQLCLAFTQNGICRDGADCKYAHGDADLQASVPPLGNALAKSVGLQSRPSFVVTTMVPVPDDVSTMVVTSASKSAIRGPTSGASTWPHQSMKVIMKDEKWTCPAAEDDPDTPSTVHATPWSSEWNYGSDSASTYSSEAWDRHVSDRSSDSISSESWRGQTKGQDPVEAAESPTTNAVLNIALTKTKMCSYFRDSFCKMGRSCKFAHEHEDLRSRPNLFRTNLCYAFERGRCKRGDTCKYAHGTEQLQEESLHDFDKTTAFHISHSGIEEQGKANKNTLQTEIATSSAAPTSSNEKDIVTDFDIQAIVKNTFVHVNVRNVVKLRRSASCEW